MSVYICILIVSILLFVAGFVLGLKYSNRETLKMYMLASKHWELYMLAVRWLKNSKSIEAYIINNGYKRICIYGMSYLGDCLASTLRNDGIEVICGIDRNADNLYNPYIPIYSLENSLPEMDLIIVTTIMYFEQIKSDLEIMLGKKIKIVSLEKILYG